MGGEDRVDKEKELKKIENEELEKSIYEHLGKVIDPELGIDIVNLGLVSEVILYEGGNCEIRVTLTTMGCPFAEVIEDDIIKALKPIKEIKEASVKLVWYPAWTPDRMTRYARIALGVR